MKNTKKSSFQMGLKSIIIDANKLNVLLEEGLKKRKKRSK